MTAKPFRVVTPFPSLAKTAKKLGVSKTEVAKITKLVDAVVIRSKRGSLERVATTKRASR